MSNPGENTPRISRILENIHEDLCEDLHQDEEKGMICEWHAANEQTLIAQNV